MDSICRTCLKTCDYLTDIFSDDISFKIEIISSLHIVKDNRLPRRVCDQCLRNIHLLYDFRSIILKSNSILQKRYLKHEEIVYEPVDLELEVKVKQEFIDDSLNNVISVTDDVETVTGDVETVTGDEETLIGDIEVATGNVEIVTEIWDNQENEQENSKDYYRCKQCEFTTSVYESLRVHKHSHKEVPKSVCNICGKSFRVDNIKKHISIHTELPVACKICGKVVKNRESLRGHLLIHKGNHYQCPICGKVYKHRGGYTAHRRRHALGDAKTVQCSVCGKLFYEKQTLAKHMRSHTGERPYPCQYCKKGFSSSHALKTHIRRHTNERPYACNHCFMAFPQKVSLMTHLKSRHPNLLIEKQNENQS